MNNAKAKDPITSKLAAIAIEQSGEAENQRIEALRAVKQFPGSTSMELAVMTGIDRYTLARRLPEINDLKQGDDRRIRKCRVTGRLSVVWDLK